MKPRLLAVAVACITVGYSFLLGTLTPAYATNPDPVADGSRFLGACMQNARSLSALFVLDTSGSLSGTDPNGVRYDGLRVALTQLGQLNHADGRALPVDVAVSGFDDGYSKARAIVGWTALNDDPRSTADVIKKVVADTRRGTAPDGGTDFERALDGGFSEFADRKGDNNCRVMFWFTDGMWEYNPSGVDAARSKVCAPGGVIDQIREARIVLIALQLGDDATDLRPMSLGTWNNRSCGTQPTPEGWAPGIYLQAADTAGLKRVFGRLNDIVQGCTPAGSSGVIDPGINRMRVTIDTPRMANTVRFDTPANTNFSAGTEGESRDPKTGYVVRSIRDDQYVSMDVVFPMGSQPGQWRVTPDVPVQPDDISFCVFSDLRLQRPAVLPDQTTGDAVISIQVIDRDGDPAAIAPYQTATPAVAIVAHGGEPRVAAARISPSGLLRITFTPEVTDARVDVNVKVHLVTQSGLALTPLSLAYPQALALPSWFPLVQPMDQLDLGTAVKTKPVGKPLRLLGSPDGPTRVCLSAPLGVWVPTDAKGTTLDYPQGCIDLATGETREVTVSVTPVAAAVGDAGGSIPVQLISAAGPKRASETAEFDLPVVWRFTDPVSVVATLLVVVVVALLSALLPLLAIGIAGWWAGRYDLRGLMGAGYDVTVTRDSLRRTEPIPDLPGRVINVLDLQYRPELGAGRTRGFTYEQVVFKSKSSFLPGRAPRFWAEAPAGYRLLATSWAPGDPTDARLVTTTPGLGFVALLLCPDAGLHGPARSEFPARLVILTKGVQLDGAKLDARVLGGLDISTLRDRLREAAPDDVMGSGTGRSSNTPDSTPPDDIWD